MISDKENITNQKRVLINEVIKTGFFDQLVQSDNLLAFLSEIWPLTEMPSTDGRYKSLYGDISQHCVNNKDYDWTFLFAELLDLYKSDDSFEKFINSLLNYTYYSMAETQARVARSINDYLMQQGYELVCIEERDGFKIFEVHQSGSLDKDEIPENSIPFYVDKVKLYRNEVRTYDYKDKSSLSYPCFVLASYDWNDYDACTQYHLFFYPEPSACRIPIGKLKIIDNSPWDRNINRYYYTDNHIDNGPFLKLTDAFCSLGQEESYYMRIKELFGENYWSVLNALRDGALFPQYYEELINAPTSYSLTRDDSVERLMREVRFKLEGRIIESRYHFDYDFKPEYSESFITVPFRFDDDDSKLYTHRISVVIGKNGVGKTSMISSLPKAISDGDSQSIRPYKPLFSKVIAISSSVYDTFEMPKNAKGQEFIYCGRTRRDGKEIRILSEAECIEILERNFRVIDKNGRAEAYLDLLSSVIGIDSYSYSKKIEDSINIEHKKLLDFYARASSGESVFIYNFSNVFANIRYDSLLVFDEPETHLHPNAISGLMSALYKLLEKYKSYAIIATHSALVVREVSADCVFIMTRDGDIPSIAKIGKESLGGNVAVLVDEIFGDKDTNKYYKEKLKSLVQDNWWTYESVVRYLHSEGVPIGLNLSLYLETICRKNEDEEDQML